MIDKSQYEKIEIPENLHSVVRAAINEGTQSERIIRFRIGRRFKKVSAVAAVLALWGVTLLNTSSVFAETACNIPVLGGVCRIFTFNEYQVKDEIKYINAQIPQIDNTGKTELERRVNLEIQKTMNDWVTESELRAKEYYDAYIETGGVAEEYIPMDITVDYEVKHVGSQYVSFVISQYESAFSAYHHNYYYNIDMESGRVLTLKDWFGDNYREEVADSIEHTIETWNEGQKSMLWEDLSVIDLISENTDFYINENGQIVVVIEKYEAACGAAGDLEFTIQTPN